MMQDEGLIGKRVELIGCHDPYTRLEPGARGSIAFVDAIGTVFVDWDNGASLGLIPGVDSWLVVNQDSCHECGSILDVDGSVMEGPGCPECIGADV